MPLKETCNDCGWSETWEGGTAAEDPAVEHARLTGHSVSSKPVPDASSTESPEGGEDAA